jgi:RNA polymerase sigma factor (sigma-70 family)
MAAFQELVTANGPGIYRLARAFVGEAAADDLAQEVFVAAWRSLPKLRDPDRFGPWLHRIALNRCRSAVRATARVREIPIGPHLPEPPVESDFRAAIEARLVVGPAFRRLPDGARSLLALHYAAGCRSVNVRKPWTSPKAPRSRGSTPPSSDSAARWRRLSDDRPPRRPGRRLPHRPRNRAGARWARAGGRAPDPRHATATPSVPRTMVGRGGGDRAGRHRRRRVGRCRTVADACASGHVDVARADHDSIGNRFILARDHRADAAGIHHGELAG